MSEVENQQLESQIRGEANRIAALIKNTRSHDTIKHLMGELTALMNNPIAKASSSIAQLISDIIAQGNTEANNAEAAEATNQSLTSEQRQVMISSNERLSDSLERNNIWLEGDKEYFESLKDRKEIVVLDETGTIVRDENGNPKTKEIDGARLQESLAIYTAFASETLDKEGKEELNLKLYGDKRGPQNEEQRKKGIERLKEANKEVEGLQAIDGDAASAEKRAQNIRKKIDAYDQKMDEVHEARHDPELQKVIEVQAEEKKTDLQSKLNEHWKEGREQRIESGTQPTQKKQPPQDKTAEAIAAKEKLSEQATITKEPHIRRRLTAALVSAAAISPDATTNPYNHDLPKSMMAENTQPLETNNTNPLQSNNKSIEDEISSAAETIKKATAELAPTINAKDTKQMEPDKSNEERYNVIDIKKSVANALPFNPARTPQTMTPQPYSRTT